MAYYTRDLEAVLTLAAPLSLLLYEMARRRGSTGWDTPRWLHLEAVLTLAAPLSLLL